MRPIPIHIPLAGALTHPDPSDVDLLTFLIFEGAFICISVAYLLGGLVKDQIATGYQRASLTDPLTGVTNRRGFFQKGERLLMRARFAREPMALIMFDLDQFKRINDSTGIMSGTRSLLRSVRWRPTHLRPNDLFGRIGGEEFASLLPDTGLEDAVWLADRVRAAIEAASYLAGEHSIRATVSVGVAFCNDATADLAGLLKAADQALYRAKEAGRNRVETSSVAAESAPLRRPDDLSIHKRSAA